MSDPVASKYWHALNSPYVFWRFRRPHSEDLGIMYSDWDDAEDYIDYAEPMVISDANRQATRDDAVMAILEHKARRALMEP